METGLMSEGPWSPEPGFSGSDNANLVSFRSNFLYAEPASKATKKRCDHVVVSARISRPYEAAPANRPWLCAIVARPPCADRKMQHNSAADLRKSERPWPG